MDVENALVAFVEQNDFKKIYRAKTPRTQRKKYFSELGALCAFARVTSISFDTLLCALCGQLSSLVAALPRCDFARGIDYRTSSSSSSS